jgi:hypothetical protein
MSVRLVQHDTHLEATVSGFKSPAGAASVIAQIGAAMRAGPFERVLIDVRPVIGQMSATDHAGVGQVLALQIGPARCAVVARADRPRGEIAPAARQGGVVYRDFDEAGEALHWLLQDAPQSGPR